MCPFVIVDPYLFNCCQTMPGICWQCAIIVELGSEHVRVFLKGTCGRCHSMNEPKRGPWRCVRTAHGLIAGQEYATFTSIVTAIKAFAQDFGDGRWMWPGISCDIEEAVWRDEEGMILELIGDEGHAKGIRWLPEEENEEVYG